MIINFCKRNLFILVLLFVSVVSHWYIIFDVNNLNAGDWTFHFLSRYGTIKDYGIYLSPFGFGQVNPFANNWVFYQIYYYLGQLGINWDVGTRIIFLLPIVFFTPLTSYFFFKKILNNSTFYAFLSACVYSFNTFFLKLQLDWLTYAYMWWVLPLFFLSTINFLERPNKKDFFFSVLLVFTGIVFEIRIMILCLVLIFSYLVYDFIVNKFADLYKYLFYGLSVFLGIFLHIFWILPMFLGGINKDVLSNASPTPFASFYNLIDVLTLHYYGWHNGLVMEPFIRQPVEVYLFFVPILVLIGLVGTKSILSNRYILKKYFVFFSTILLIALYLSKQEYEPFGYGYRWLFYHFPLFNLYRESSKFIIFVALCTSLFFSLGFRFIRELSVSKLNTKLINTVIGVVFIFFLFSNLKGFITQDVGGMVKGIDLHPDYSILENLIINQSNDFFRIVYLPRTPRFGYYDNMHPFVDSIDLVKQFKNITKFDLFDPKSNIEDQIMFLYEGSYSKELFDLMSIKYIVVPPEEKRIQILNDASHREVSQIFYDYGERQNENIRDEYLARLDNLPWLKRVPLPLDSAVVYENVNYLQPIFVISDKNNTYEQVNINHISPTVKMFSLKSGGKSDLVFNEKFSLNWTMYPQEGFVWWKAPFLKPIADKNHYVEYGYANAWNLSQEDLDRARNEKGEVELVLYFLPQTYFYYGLTISLSTLFGLVCYIFYKFINKS